MKLSMTILYFLLSTSLSSLVAQNCNLGETKNRRIQITQMSNPYSYIAHLTMKRGKSYTGSAFFIHPRVLLTAGHNLRKRPQFIFTRVKKITLRVGATGPNTYLAKEQYKTTQNENIYTLESFNTEYNIYEDYGIIILPDENIYKKISGHFKLIIFHPDLIKETEINIAGYPRDKDDYTLWADKTKNCFSYKRNNNNPGNLDYLKYDFTTEYGVSGAPVWVAKGNYNLVFAIHTYGNDNDDTKCNTATLITKEIFDNIKSFCKSKGVEIEN